jgi:hypothetical protein
VRVLKDYRLSFVAAAGFALSVAGVARAVPGFGSAGCVAAGSPLIAGSSLFLPQS